MACNKDELECSSLTNDYLIFGKFYSECGGNCVILFKITEKELFEDELTEGFPPTIPTLLFKSTPLNASKFQIAKVLKAQLPAELLQANQNQFGCPDCGDQGGFYVEWYSNGERKIWTIDTWEREQPTYLIPYTRKIEEVMQQLR